MKKELKAECFTNVNELCSFVNEKKISQENIQTIIETAVYDIDGFGRFHLLRWNSKKPKSNF